MAPSAIVALCLLALTSAAPQNLQAFQCASSCDMSKQPTVGEIGKTYTYSYNVQSTINVAGVQDATTQGQLAGTVHVSRMNPCEMAIKFTSTDETALVNKYPLLVSLAENDQFGRVCAHQEDDSESVNIKKGIASALQYSLPSMEPVAKKIVAEKSILGTCPTVYSVQSNEQVITVNKETIHSECKDHAYSHSDIPSILTKSPMPVQVSKSVCQQFISFAKVRQKVACKDTKVVRPAYGTYKYIEATQESTLQFISESADELILESVLMAKQWSYEHAMPAKNPAIVGKLDSVLKNVCSMVQGQGHQDAASNANEAIELLKHIPADAFVTVLNKIRAGEYCADFAKLEALFMDAVAFIGEPGAVTVMAQEVSAGRVTGGRLALYTAALHLLSKPTANHVAALAPIVAMEDPSSTLTLAAASIVNKHCTLVTGCENTATVKNILNVLAGKLEAQCTPAISNSKPVTVLTTLKALGNIGFMAPEHAEKIVKCAKTEGVDINVRFAAAMALKGVPCVIPIKNMLLAIALDASMNTEVRIGAFLSAIKCVEAKDILEIITKITADANKQVQTFVFAHLSNLKESNWPQKEDLRKWLSNVNIPSYESNIFKYSKNIEVSHNSPVLGLGAAVESNIVYVPDSYLPRLVNLGLDMNLLGSFINIGEVGARVEGLDPIMKEAFGPESYLYKTPLKTIIQDTSLFIKQTGVNIYNNLEKLIRQEKSFDINAIMQSLSRFFKDSNIKLPKTDLYAKLMGQEFAFLSVAGPMQQVNINNIIETITSSIVDALVAVKNLDIDTTRAGHLHLDYSIPTIQGIPLKIKLQGTAVVGVKALSKVESKATAHDVILKIIPSLSIAIDGIIGYGAAVQHGLKMKNSIYSTNGVALYATLKDGKDLEVKVELPEKMELINVKSEVYLMNNVNTMMEEVKIIPNPVNDPRIAQQNCLTFAEPITGLHICYDINIPNVLSSKSVPLGLPVTFNIYLQKADPNLKGYRVLATLKNKVERKFLKMVVGTYGSAASAESSVKLIYEKEANAHIVAASIKTVWFASNVDAAITNQADLVSVQIIADHKFAAGVPVAVACKFNIKNEAIANGKKYQIYALAGLTKSLTDAHRLLVVEVAVAGNGLTNFNIVTDVKAILGTSEIGLAFTIKHENLVFDIIWELKNAGANIFIVNIKHSIATKLYTTAVEIKWPTLPKTLKINQVIEVVELLTYRLVTDVLIDNTALVHVEGPVSWQFTNALVKYNIDLKVSGAFDGNIKIMHAALISHEKTQFIVDMRHATTPLVFVDILVDRTNAAETTAKAIIHLPVVVKAEYAAVISSGLIHASMNTFVLPTTSVARRFKGYADWNLTDKKIKADLLWDAEKDANKKLSLTSAYLIDASAGKISVQGDMAIISLTYEYKLEAMLASPFEWFHGTTGVEFVVTAPSKQMYITKAMVTVKYAESVVIIKPILSIHTLEVSGSIAVKKLSAFLNYDITTEVNIIAPVINQITIDIANKFLHEDKDGACIFSFRAGITGLPEAIGVEFVHEASANKCTTWIKIGKGTSVTGVTSNITPISGLKAFDITVDVILPFASVKALAVRATKTAEGYTTITFFKNQLVLAKVHYTMATLLAHTISFESPSRTIEIFAGIKGNEMTWKVFPEKNVSPKVVQAIVRVSKKTESAHIECFVTAPWLANEMRLAAVFALADPTVDDVINVDIHFPVTEFMALVNAVVDEVKVIVADLVKDGLLPDMTIWLNKLKVALKDFPTYLNTIKVQLIELINKYWPVIRDWVMKMWQVLSEGDIIAFLNNLHIALLHCWEILKTEVPVIYNNIMETLMKSELWKVLHHLVLEIINALPIDLITKNWPIVKNWVLNKWAVYEADIMEFLKIVHLELIKYWQFLKVEVPVIFNNFMATLKKTELWKILNGMVNELINRYPAVFNILVDFYNKVILTTVAELEKMVNMIMAIPTFSFGGVWNILKIEIPVVFANLKTQLLNTDLVKLIVGKLQDLRAYFPTVFDTVVDVWAHLIVPTFNDIAALLKKLMNIKFTNVWELIDLLVVETLNFSNNLLTHLMNCNVVQMIVAKVTLFIKANPIIVTLYKAVADAVINTVMALKNDFTMIWEQLMTFPLIKKLVDYILHIFNSKDINLGAVTWESFTAGSHVFVSEVLGLTYTLSANHFTAVIPLPCSVTTLSNIWTNITAYLSAFLTHVIRILNFVIETIPVALKAGWLNANAWIKFISFEIPIILEFIKIETPKMINGWIPNIKNFFAFVKNTHTFKLVMAKADELIKMYPAEWAEVKAFIESIIDNTMDRFWKFYDIVMKFPWVRAVVNYFYQIINKIDIHATMVSSISSVSSSVSSFASLMYNDVPAFVKLHTPTILSAWLTSSA